jgi:hypothetical protein
MVDFYDLESRARRISPGVADMLQAGETLMQSRPPLAATVSLVSHCMREIESAIRSVFRSIVMLDEKLVGDDAQTREINLFAKSFAHSSTDEPFKFWLSFAASLHKFAHRPNLERARPITTDFVTRWHAFLIWVQNVVDLIEIRTSDIYETIDRFFADGRSPKQICNLFKSSVPQNENTLSYFLGKVEGLEWFNALRKNHFFDNPPPVRKTGQGYTWQMWPPSRSLIEFTASGLIPANELDVVIRKLADVSSPSIQADLVKVALLLPGSRAISTARAASKWLEAPFRTYEMPDLIASLAEHLALAGELVEAEKLVFASLSVRRIRKGRRTIDTRIGIYSDYSLKKIIPRFVSILSNAGYLETLQRTCTLLRVAATAKSNSKSGRTRDDHAKSWRRAIESDPRERDYESSTYLVDLVRDLAITLINQGSSGDEIVSLLLSQRSGICRRIGLWILSQKFLLAPGAVQSTLKQVTRWNRYPYEREFWQLARAVSLGHPDSAKPLIAKLPKLVDGLTKLSSQYYPSAYEAVESARWWHYERLYLLRPALDKRSSELLIRLQAEYGQLDRDPLEPNFPRPLAERSSPKSIDIADMGPRQIVEFVTSFSDGSGLMDAYTVFGDVKSAIASDPVKYADEAYAFVMAGPESVSTVLRGFEWAVSADKSLPWDGLLRLVDFVIASKWTEGRWDTRSPSWAAEAASEVLDQGLRRLGSGILDTELPRVFDQLSGLLEFPSGVEDDVIGSLVNSVRQRTLGTLLGLVWRCRELSHPLYAEAVTALHSTVDAFLLDGSPEILECLGRQFVEIEALSPDYAVQLAPLLFPLDGEPRAFVAAWGGYSIHRNPSSRLMRLLAMEYVRAVELMIVGVASVPRGSAVDGLVTDLQYGGVFWGIAELQSALTRFYQLASGELRDWMLQQVGFTLYHSDKPIEPGVLQRVERFIDARLQACAEQGTPEDVKEVRGFIRVATSEAFRDDWVLPRLLACLEMGPDVADFGVLINYLAKASAFFPDVAIQCLDALYRARASGDTVVGIEEEVKQILEAAEDSGVEVAQQLATNVRSRLIHEAGTRFRRVAKS